MGLYWFILFVMFLEKCMVFLSYSMDGQHPIFGKILLARVLLNIPPAMRPGESLSTIPITLFLDSFCDYQLFSDCWKLSYKLRVSLLFPIPFVSVFDESEIRIWLSSCYGPSAMIPLLIFILAFHVLTLFSKNLFSGKDWAAPTGSIIRLCRVGCPKSILRARNKNANDVFHMKC